MSTIYGEGYIADIGAREARANPALPELPVRHETRENTLGEVLWEDVHGPYTPEEMRDYARRAVLAERERCARLCEAQIAGWTAKDQLSPDVPWEAETLGGIIMSEDCAAAIRAEMSKEEGR